MSAIVKGKTIGDFERGGWLSIPNDVILGACGCQLMYQETLGSRIEIDSMNGQVIVAMATPWRQ
jgi:hypothetical protein